MTKGTEDGEQSHTDIEVAKIGGRTSIVIALVTAFSGWLIAITTNFDRLFHKADNESSFSSPVRLRITEINGTDGLPILIRFYAKTSSASGQPVSVNMTYPSERPLYQIGSDLDAREYPVWLDSDSGLPILTARVWYVYRTGGDYVASDNHTRQSVDFHLDEDLEFGELYRTEFRPARCWNPEPYPDYFPIFS